MKKVRVKKRRADNLITAAEKHARLGELKQAADICRAELRRNPDDVEALFLLGSVMLLGGNYGDSEGLLLKALAINPNHVGILNNLGVLYRDYHKNLKASVEMFHRVVSLSPRHIHALINLGNIYCDLNQHDLGEKYYRQALAINPADGTALGNLGLVYDARQEYDNAIESYYKALQSLPDNPGFLRNLILSLYTSGDKLEAVSQVNHVAHLSNPGIALVSAYSVARRLCLWDVSEAVRKRMLSLVVSGGVDVQGFEMMNLDILADPALSDHNNYEIHLLAGRAVAGQCMKPPYSWEEVSKTSGRMKIGYISGDFRRHVVSTFFIDTFSYHDKEHFETYCYSGCNLEDEVTKEYRAAADHYVDVSRLPDIDVAERIHSDGIHVLVNLAGYTKGGRVGVMAYRPAPVQIMYLGYPYTSGLTSVDYILSDPFLCGPQSAALFTEKQLCLPESFLAFATLGEQAPVLAMPFQRNGFVTFGSLNNIYKLTPKVISVWSNILQRLSDSRMIINHPNCELEITRRNILSEFEKNGIEEKRIKIIWGKHPTGSHLSYYNDIDVVLDTFPLTGGTTTIDALWMGVPVVTLVGRVHQQRLSYSVLNNIGIEVGDLIAFSEEEYIRKAVALACNPARIDDLHRFMPENIKASTLCNPARFARQLEAAYADGWKQKFGVFPVVEPEKVG